MRICAAQISPVPGDIRQNIETHKKLITSAESDGAAIVIFPELSLTGYEPTMARDLATDLDDTRFDDFQEMSDLGKITIGVGVPTKQTDGVCISMLLFQPNVARSMYSKSYLHPDEERFFVRGQSSAALRLSATRIALGICYEISVQEHLDAALTSKPELYFASVAKFQSGIQEATGRLSLIARSCAIPVLMSNCTGFLDGGQCAGRSSAWKSDGALIAQLSDSGEGTLVVDTVTCQHVERML